MNDLIIHSIANMIILTYEYERYSDLGLDMCIHIYNKSVAFESVLAFKVKDISVHIGKRTEKKN